MKIDYAPAKGDVPLQRMLTQTMPLKMQLQGKEPLNSGTLTDVTTWSFNEEGPKHFLEYLKQTEKTLEANIEFREKELALLADIDKTILDSNERVIQGIQQVLSGLQQKKVKTDMVKPLAEKLNNLVKSQNQLAKGFNTKVALESDKKQLAATKEDMAKLIAACPELK